MSAEKEQKSHATAWTIALTLLPVLYVLSIGPMDYLYFRGIPTSQRWEDIYTPLHWLCRHTPLNEPFKAYRNWWSHLALKDEPPLPQPHIPNDKPPQTEVK